MTPSADLDAVLLAHMRECLDRIDDYTGRERARFMASRMVQDADVISSVVERELPALRAAVDRLLAMNRSEP